MFFFHTELIFTTEVFILCKKVRLSRGLGSVNFDIASLLHNATITQLFFSV